MLIEEQTSHFVLLTKAFPKNVCSLTVHFATQGVVSEIFVHSLTAKLQNF